MSETPPVQPQRLVECPECGLGFARRGIVAHRRMRHGIAPEAVVELAGTLSRIATVLERLDARLSVNGAPASPSTNSVDEVAAPLPASRSVDSPGRLLEEGVRDVLAEIARVKKETELQLATLGEQAPTEVQEKLEKTTFRALATLRRRQADLLYRLQCETDAAGGLDPLSAL